MFPVARTFVNIRIGFPRIQINLIKINLGVHSTNFSNISMTMNVAQNSLFIEFKLLKNIDQPIPIILVKVDTYILQSYVRGYHAYMNIWNPKVGDNDVVVKHEKDNEHDKFAIAVFHKERIVRHLPKNLSKLFYQFFPLPNCTSYKQ